MTIDDLGRRPLDRAEGERLAAAVQPARPELAGMDRAQLLARLDELLGGGDVVVHHRDLEEMTEVDLRSAVADLEALQGEGRP